MAKTVTRKAGAPRAAKPKPKAPPAPGFTRVVLLDADRNNGEERDIPTGEHGYRISVGGKLYVHVSDRAEDGAWEYAPPV